MSIRSQPTFLRIRVQVASICYCISIDLRVFTFRFATPTSPCKQRRNFSFKIHIDSVSLLQLLVAAFVCFFFQISSETTLSLLISQSLYLLYYLPVAFLTLLCSSEVQMFSAGSWGSSAAQTPKVEILPRKTAPASAASAGESKRDQKTSSTTNPGGFDWSGFSASTRTGTTHAHAANAKGARRAPRQLLPSYYDGNDDLDDEAAQLIEQGADGDKDKRLSFAVAALYKLDSELLPCEDLTLQPLPPGPWPGCEDAIAYDGLLFTRRHTAFVCSFIHTRRHICGLEERGHFSVHWNNRGSFHSANG